MAIKANDTAQAQSTVEAPQAQAQGALTTEAVAAQAGCTAKELRRWMRATARRNGEGDTLPGRGRRYGFTQAEADVIAQGYGAARHVTTGATASALARILTAPAE